MFILQVSSSDQLEIEPEYDFTRKDMKKESEFRVCDGGLWVYKWGDYQQWKFGWRWVSSADMCKVNSWWGGNQKLEFYDLDSPADVSSVMIRSKNPPINKYEKPYTNLYKGAIQLSTY